MHGGHSNQDKTMIFRQFFPSIAGVCVQGCHFPDNMKFPDFSRPGLSSTVSPRPFRGIWGHAPLENFKMRIFNLAENEFQTTNIPDFWNSAANSLTFWRFLSNSLTFPGFSSQWQPCVSSLMLVKNFDPEFLDFGQNSLSCLNNK